MADDVVGARLDDAMPRSAWIRTVPSKNGLQPIAQADRDSPPASSTTPGTNQAGCSSQACRRKSSPAAFGTSAISGQNPRFQA